LALGEASGAAARGDTATPTKAHDKNAKDSKAGAQGCRSGGKCEVGQNKGRPLFFIFCTSLFYTVHIFIPESCDVLLVKVAPSNKIGSYTYTTPVSKVLNGVTIKKVSHF
jgi:hypothetical protein